ncbi:type VI secretion system protein ImpH [Duganella sp. CF458]|uniref:type VI secretion system baseplate subunit TssG n=1 Tax=Duganella sp. CF458 TaxID=1884368 RepID=UPI0008E1A0E5|nr:type VI secretion system baseplate subunit TssG [Duganella sp. CF458]SFG09494.1 type VI secretion system protein ImpH [Duganella sp. CF458]
MRDRLDHLTYFQALETAPYRHDFFQALRRVECLFPQLPRIGQALRPADEPLRLAQEAAMDFAPATLSSFGLAPGAPAPRLAVRFFGLLGPNGPLPLHLTEFARSREQHAGDLALTRFLDLFHHRFLALFYRAWAQAQPTVSLDRPRDDRFSLYVGALCGLGDASLRERDAVQDNAKLFYAGLLSRQIRNSDGLVALLSGYFRVPVTLEPYVGHWLALPVEERTRLGGRRVPLQAAVGQGAVLGRRVWDRQYKFRLCLGPLDLAQLEQFLPGGPALSKLVSWVRQYLCLELDWDVRLLLKREQVPAARLGKHQRLGWSTWLGTRERQQDARDLVLDPERLQAGLSSKGKRHG